MCCAFAVAKRMKWIGKYWCFTRTYTCTDYLFMRTTRISFKWRGNHDECIVCVYACRERKFLKHATSMIFEYNFAPIDYFLLYGRWCCYCNCCCPVSSLTITFFLLSVIVWLLLCFEMYWQFNSPFFLWIHISWAITCSQTVILLPSWPIGISNALPIRCLLRSLKRKNDLHAIGCR